MVVASDTGVLRVVEALEAEVRIVAKLLRLTHRQQRYLVRGDLRRVQMLTEPQLRCVEEAKRATRERQAALAAMGLAGQKGHSALKSVARIADTPLRERVERAAEALARATERLGRKNVQNHQIARFSLDLVGEEMRLILGAPDESKAAYDADGVVADGSTSGAIDGRA